jgi:hypothetical protein
MYPRWKAWRRAALLYLCNRHSDCERYPLRSAVEIRQCPFQWRSSEPAFGQTLQSLPFCHKSRSCPRQVRLPLLQFRVWLRDGLSSVFDTTRRCFATNLPSAQALQRPSSAQSCDRQAKARRGKGERDQDQWRQCRSSSIANADFRDRLAFVCW